MSSESTESNKNFPLSAGEINLNLIPKDWALTPLREKRAYVPNWPSQPYSIEQIKHELSEGNATGIGLITGQWSNEGGLLWVDIDGEEGEEALVKEQPDYVIIANQTSEHFETLMTLAELGFEGTILIEKPLFQFAQPLPNISHDNKFVAYNLRFHPLIQKLKNFLE